MRPCCNAAERSGGAALQDLYGTLDRAYFAGRKTLEATGEWARIGRALQVGPALVRQPHGEAPTIIRIRDAIDVSGADQLIDGTADCRGSATRDRRNLIQCGRGVPLDCGEQESLRTIGPFGRTVSQKFLGNSNETRRNGGW